MINIGIIGGGASGLFLANYLMSLLQKEKTIESNIQITIFERLEKVGKKILVTGNGRCNLTNMNVGKDKYNNGTFVLPAITYLTPKKLVDYFKDIGLVSYSDSDGRVYPNSDSANSVLDILRFNMKKAGIVEKVNEEVKKVLYKDNKFLIETSRKNKYTFDFCILSTGGAASSVHGSNGSGFVLAKSLKHKITSISSGLTQVIVPADEVKMLNGIKVHPVVSLYDKKRKKFVFTTSGELLFKSDSLSGIVMFEVASYVSRNPSSYEVYIDLMPNFRKEKVIEMLIHHKELFSDEDVSCLFTGIFNKMLGQQIIKKAKVNLNNKCLSLKDKDIQKLASTIKEYVIPIKGVGDLSKAQVTVGGVSLSDVNNETMESKIVNNLYFTGEILDIDGLCGGYNMHFAFASSALCSQSILKKIKGMK